MRRAWLVASKSSSFIGCNLRSRFISALHFFGTGRCIGQQVAATGTLSVTTATRTHTKLTPAEYEETTWSARSWTTFAAQKISVALHYAAAFEISMALRVPKFDQAELDAAAARRMAGGG